MSKQNRYLMTEPSQPNGPAETTASIQPALRKIAPSTIAQYQKFVKILRRSLLRASPLIALQEDILPSDIVDHLNDRARRGELRPKTFINYRCGVLYWLSNLPKSEEVEKAMWKLQNESPRDGFKGATPGTRTTLHSTRSMRRRTFRSKDFDRLLNELVKRSDLALVDGRGTERSIELMLWLRAGLASGLRPSEWETACWKSRATGELLVHTAKTKSSYSDLETLKNLPVQTPQTRIVRIEPQEQLWVERHMNAVKRHLATGANFSKYYDNCRVYLWKVCRALFGETQKKAFTLYSMRGQFAANGKSRAGLAATARELGCAPAVASVYYGSRVHAHRTSSSNAAPRHVNAFRDDFFQYHAPKESRGRRN